MYICKYCGQKGQNSGVLAMAWCPKSPFQKHAIVKDRAIYVCKHCGQQSHNHAMLLGKCTGNPQGFHELIE